MSGMFGIRRQSVKVHGDVDRMNYRALSGLWSVRGLAPQACQPGLDYFRPFGPIRYAASSSLNVYRALSNGRGLETLRARAITVWST